MTRTANRSSLNNARFSFAPEQRLSLPSDTVEVDLDFAQPEGGEGKNWTGICNVTVSIIGVIGKDADNKLRYTARIGDFGVYDIAVNSSSCTAQLLGRRS